MLPRSLETMSSYAEKRFLPYTPALLFEVVAAVDRYPEFLPWCLAVRTRSSEKLQGTPEKALIVADLVIGSRMIREQLQVARHSRPNALTLPMSKARSGISTATGSLSLSPQAASVQEAARC
jgi:ribosome-associated toxin RatA of RatAB toxin-antitoxin module